MFVIFVIIVIIVVTQSGFSAPFCPRHASWRLDRHMPTPPEATGTWIERSRHYNEAGELVWGQSSCSGIGNDCHLNDWFTWWYPIVLPPPKPEPQNEYESIELPCVPDNYNPNTGKYICE